MKNQYFDLSWRKKEKIGYKINYATFTLIIFKFSKKNKWE